MYRLISVPCWPSCIWSTIPSQLLHSCDPLTCMRDSHVLVGAWLDLRNYSYFFGGIFIWLWRLSSTKVKSLRTWSVFRCRYVMESWPFCCDENFCNHFFLISPPTQLRNPFFPQWDLEQVLSETCTKFVTSLVSYKNL